MPNHPINHQSEIANQQRIRDQRSEIDTGSGSGSGSSRRAFLATLGAGIVAAGASGLAAEQAGPAQPAAALKGRIKQGVTRGVFARAASFEDCCRDAARLGIKGFDLVAPADWPMLKKYGLVSSMYPLGPGGTIADALNRRENHAKLDASLRAAIDECAANQVPNVITFSGNRRGMADQEGADNCVAFLDNIKAHAEDKGVTICMELLNSKVNHRDYMFDHMAWGVDVMKRVNSPRVRILYDIYHAQIMDGDIVRTIRDDIQWIAHFHTGGNPGRNDIDETQELNYHFVMQEIAKLGFTGFVSHEYSPKAGSDPIAVLKKAIEICDV
jgi:hydroxypyruvate isomerase